MATGDSNVLSIRNGDLREDVEQYRQDAGYEDRSDALEDLIRTGLREAESPFLLRLREQAINYANLLVIFALVFAAGGVVTSQVALSTGLLMCGVLLVFAAALVAVVELARVANGQSVVGAAVRGWFL